MRKFRSKAAEQTTKIATVLSSEPSSHHYTYPNSVVLKNKYGITDLAALDMQCAHDTAQAIIRIREEPLPENFDSTYLKHIHKSLFSNAFEWAGHTRDVSFKFEDGTSAVMPNMKKMSMEAVFASGDQIKDGLQKLDTMLAEKNNLRGLTHKEFAHEAAEVFCLLNHMRPFRRGNECVQRVFLENLAKAAGHQLDFTLVSKERMRVASVAAIQDGNVDPVHHLFEDISNPQKIRILKEFMTHMKNTGRDDLNGRFVVAANEGETYSGIYRGAHSEGFMIDMKDFYVVGKKESLRPEQLRALRPGDQFTFTVPTDKILEESLIPAEKVSALTKEEISEMLLEDACVQVSKEQIQKLSKIVYGNPKTLDAKMNLMLQDPALGEKFSNQIAKYPTSVASLAGVDLFCIKSQTRADAEENILLLSCAVSNYAHALTYAKKEILKEHQAEQNRREKSVEMPSKSLQDLLFLPKAQQREALSHSFMLRKELQVFVDKLHERLSPSEHKAINTRDYEKLAESIGTSVNKAREITDIVAHTKEAYQQSKILKVSHSKVMAMTG
ncbi:BID domain-containing T4SS effector [Bartonella sp. B10]